MLKLQMQHRHLTLRWILLYYSAAVVWHWRQRVQDNLNAWLSGRRERARPVSVIAVTLRPCKSAPAAGPIPAMVSHIAEQSINRRHIRGVSCPLNLL